MMFKKLSFILVIVILSILAISGISNADKKNDIEIVTDKNLMKQSLGVVICWYAYAGKLKEEVGKEVIENDKKIIISFESELAARTRLVQAWKESKLQNEKNGFKCLTDTYLDQLEQVSDNDFLPEYVYYFLKQDHWEDRSDLRIDEFTQWAGVNIKEHKVLTLAHLKRK